jgi:hypothetical protein
MDHKVQLNLNKSIKNKWLQMDVLMKLIILDLYNKNNKKILF